MQLPPTRPHTGHAGPRLRLRFAGQEITLPVGVLTVGRSEECAVTIDDPLASRQHATITVAGGKATLRDLGSRNGTFVNGQRLDADRVLEHGDEISFGSRKAVFLTVAPALARTDTEQQVAVDHTHPTPLSDVDRHRWWVDMHLTFVDKALGSNTEQAIEGFDRLARGIGARMEPGEMPIAVEQLEKLTMVTARVAEVTLDPTKLGWLFELFARIDILPTSQVLRELDRAFPHMTASCAASIDVCRAHWASRRAQVGIERSLALEALDEIARGVALRRSSAESDPDTITKISREPGIH